MSFLNVPFCPDGLAVCPHPATGGKVNAAALGWRPVLGIAELAIAIAAIAVLGIGVTAFARFLLNVLHKRTRAARPRIAQPRHRGYRVFTTEFDQVAEPYHAVHGVLGPLSPELRQQSVAQWREFQADSDGLRALLRLSAVKAAARIGALLPPDGRNDIVVSLLLDHSGSLRNRPILVTAMSVHAALECLNILGIRTEVLGFTTSAWKGGRSREKWAAAGKRPGPGRLNDVLYIVYRNATDRSPLNMDMFRTMLRRDLLKENIDGEAMEWAERRLKARWERRKLLIHVSDGAPIDDSTVYENGDKYLPRHFEAVVRRIERERNIETGCVLHTGTQPPVFARARKCESVETLGEELLALIEDMLLSEIAMVRRRATAG